MAVRDLGRLVWVVILGLGGASGCIAEGTCNSRWEGVRESTADRDRFAVLIESEPVRGYLDRSVVLHGELVNTSTESDCPVAIYVFDDATEPGPLPTLSLGQPVPQTLEGGGRLIFQELLPRAGEYQWPKRVSSGDYGGSVEVMPEFDDIPPGPTVVALATCAEPELRYTLQIYNHVCREGEREPRGRAFARMKML